MAVVFHPEDLVGFRRTRGLGRRPGPPVHDDLVERVFTATRLDVHHEPLCLGGQVGRFVWCRLSVSRVAFEATLGTASCRVQDRLGYELGMSDGKVMIAIDDSYVCSAVVPLQRGGEVADGFR